MSITREMSTVMTARGRFKVTMERKVAARVAAELMIWGMLWPKSCRRVSTSLV